jgi:hypothetical protein
MVKGYAVQAGQSKDLELESGDITVEQFSDFLTYSS